MNRFHRYLFSLVLVLSAGFSFTGCGDELLPPEDNSGNRNNNQNNNQTNSDKITLEGDLVLATPLPDYAKVVLIWSVSATSPDYSYVYGKGTIDRANGTFKLTLDGPPPIPAVNWYTRATYDTGMGVAVLAVVAGSLPEGQILYDNYEDIIYGTVNFSNLLYFPIKPDWWTMFNQPECHGWMNNFNQGYRWGTGIEAADGCTFDGFSPASPEGLKLIVNSNFDFLDFVNWT